RAHTKEDEVYEAAPDYIASEQEHTDTPALAASSAQSAPAVPINPAPQDLRLRVAATSKSTSGSAVSPAASAPAATIQTASLKVPEQPRGTVILDVAGGTLVPDFRGKSLRTALEEAESSGLELEVSGSGVGQTQSPAAGSRVSPGGHVNVVFGR
ncbi:MAG TPA: PASTA domain-containing protein, partial [Candidatus Angelobacter sp.]